MLGEEMLSDCHCHFILSMEDFGVSELAKKHFAIVSEMDLHIRVQHTKWLANN